jgi:hypothetical protein
MITNTDKITIRDEHLREDEDDVCAVALDCESAAERCLTEADALPDGSPEQISVLLRGQLAAQLATMRMTMLIVGKLDAWPQTHAEWHSVNPGQRCVDGEACPWR